MKLNVLRDEKKQQIMGFDLISCGDAEEEAFNRDLPSGLASGSALMDVTEEGLVISNPKCTNAKINGLLTRFVFPLTIEDANDLKAVFDSPKIRPRASVRRGFGYHFEARFERL
jgi:hypothetical protein